MVRPQGRAEPAVDHLQRLAVQEMIDGHAQQEIRFHREAGLEAKANLAVV
jgi:hypothetical protein